MEETKRELERDHLKKFEAVSKQIQLLQNSELDKLRSVLEREHSSELQLVRQELEAQFKAEWEQTRTLLEQDHQTELDRLRGKNLTSAQILPRVEGEDAAPSLSADGTDTVHVGRLEADLLRLEAERDELRSMQRLMKNLISDLALHYSLSEKQVRFLSDSTFFDSFFEGKLFDSSEPRLSSKPNTPYKYFAAEADREENAASDVETITSEVAGSVEENEPDNSKIATPDQSVMDVGEISELLRNGSFLSVLENSEEVFHDLRRQVKKSNQALENLAPGALLQKLSGLLTPPNHKEEQGNFVGLEAGRLEVEKARLELELAASRQRIQELELCGRHSRARSEVISGLGGDISGRSFLSASGHPLFYLLIVTRSLVRFLWIRKGCD